MANEISKITLPSGVTYDIKDAVARQAAAGGVKYAGVTTTALTDGSTASKITIGGNEIDAENGMLAIYQNKEFIYSTADSKWHEFGDMSSLGDLAYYDKVTYTAPTGTGSATFEGTAFTTTVKGTPAGTIGVATSGDGTTYTPAGTVACPTITVTPTSDANGYVASSATGGGSVTNGSAASCTLPTFTATVPTTGTDVQKETLTIGWTDGSFTANTPTAVTLPSFTAKTIVTAVDTAAGTPESVALAGTAVKLSFSGTELTSTGSNTATGTITDFTVGTITADAVPGNNS